MSTLATFSIIICLPVFLRYLSSKPDKDQSPISDHASKYVSIGLALYAIFLVSLLARSPQNLLSDLNCTASTPSYLLRNAFRHYMTTQDPDWTESYSTSVGKAQDDEQLYGMLISSTNRKLYLSFGHDAFVGCAWCTDENDYTLYMLPSVISLYCSTLIVIGIASIFRSKSTCRLYGLIFLVALALVEAGVYASDFQEVLILVRAFKFGIEATHDDLRILRIVCMAILSLVASLWNSRIIWSEADKLKELLAKTTKAYNMRQANMKSR